MNHARGGSLEWDIGRVPGDFDKSGQAGQEQLANSKAVFSADIPKPASMVKDKQSTPCVIKIPVVRIFSEYLCYSSSANFWWSTI
ncbi:MAG: hypothetical protein FIB02_03930 [Desulfuromonas sp.]|nr:hypothetical protein [Desulfuromonas sp.]